MPSSFLSATILINSTFLYHGSCSYILHMIALFLCRLGLSCVFYVPGQPFFSDTFASRLFSVCLGGTSSLQRIKCLIQGRNAVLMVSLIPAIIDHQSNTLPLSHHTHFKFKKNACHFSKMSICQMPRTNFFAFHF